VRVCVWVCVWGGGGGGGKGGLGKKGKIKKKKKKGIKKKNPGQFTFPLSTHKKNFPKKKKKKKKT